jgi:hypothetical protein
MWPLKRRKNVVTNGSTPLGGVEGTGTPWNAREGSSPQGLQGSKAYKYSVPAHCRFCSVAVYRQSITTKNPPKMANSLYKYRTTTPKYDSKILKIRSLNWSVAISWEYRQLNDLFAQLSVSHRFWLTYWPLWVSLKADVESQWECWRDDKRSPRAGTALFIEFWEGVTWFFVTSRSSLPISIAKEWRS